MPVEEHYEANWIRATTETAATLAPAPLDLIATGSGGLDLAIVHLLTGEVLGRCPRPVGAHQVAVLLETDGYNPERCRELGASGVMEIAAAVWHIIDGDDREATAVAATMAPHRIGTRHPTGAVPHLRAMAYGLLYSAPWLIAMITLLVAGVSYWASAVATPTVSVALTLALIFALVITAPFIQAFARRGSFYFGFGANRMLAYIVTRTLIAGLALAGTCALALWLIREQILHDGTPATNRLAAVGVFVLAAFELGLAPLYLRRAFWVMIAIIAPGAAWMGFVLLERGYVNPIRLAWDQVWVVAGMAALAWTASGLVLFGPGRWHGTRMWTPRTSATIRAVLPYAVYGTAAALVVAIPQLVAAGALGGGFAYNQTFAIASGAALLVLVPTLAEVSAATERFVGLCVDRMNDYSLDDVAQFRVDVYSYWRLHLALTLAIGAGTATLAAVIVPRVGLVLLNGLDVHPWLFWTCMAGFALLAVGLFDAQLLFCLSNPAPAVAAALFGALAGLVTPVLLAVAAPGTALATRGALAMVGGAGVFAVAASVGAWRMLRRADLAWYRSL